MTPEHAAAAHDILVERAGADREDRYSFIFHICKPQPTTEYRFGGLLGHGGKFRNPRDGERIPYIDCYPEDLTDERRAIIGDVNAELVALFSSLDTPPYHDDPDVIMAKQRMA